MDEIIESIEAIDQNKPPSHYIGDYAVLDLLGSGAFGSVYRVKKKTSGESYLAMKEVWLSHNNNIYFFYCIIPTASLLMLLHSIIVIKNY